MTEPPSGGAPSIWPRQRARSSGKPCCALFVGTIDVGMDGRGCPESRMEFTHLVCPHCHDTIELVTAWGNERLLAGCGPVPASDRGYEPGTNDGRSRCV